MRKRIVPTMAAGKTACETIDKEDLKLTPTPAIRLYAPIRTNGDYQQAHYGNNPTEDVGDHGRILGADFDLLFFLLSGEL